MKCLVLHESDTRIRIRIPKLSMSLHQADLLEYYLKDIPGVKKVSVDERTGNAVIVFSDNKAEKRQMLNQALRDYDETSEKVAALVPEETGRALNREYEENPIIEYQCTEEYIQYKNSFKVLSFIEIIFSFFISFLYCLY